MTDDHDDLDERLLRMEPRPPAAPDAPAEDFQARLLRRTTAAVRRQARFRRARAALGLVLTLSAGYAAGLATAWSVEHGAPPATRPRDDESAASAIAEGPAPSPPAGSDDPGELERRASGSVRAERVRLLQLAGDRYLTVRCDVERALGCYRQALDLMSQKELAQSSAQESWLFSALKHSRI